MTREPNFSEFTAARVGAPATKEAALLCELAAFQLMHGRVEEAQHMARAALWLAPEHGSALRIMAHAHAKAGRPLDAAKAMIAAGRARGMRLSLRDWRAIGASMLAHGHRELGLKYLFKR
ncbi:MAG: hypothetical protein AAF841_01065 [Pseudomonadota bacterium]